MDTHLGTGGGEPGRLLVVCFAPAVNETIGRARPFQSDVGAVKGLGSEETAVQRFALFFQYADRYIHSRFAQHGDASTLNLGKAVNATYYHARNAGLDDERSAGRCATVVGARFQADIEGTVGEQCTVCRADGTQRIDFCVGLSALYVVAFANDAAIVNEYGTLPTQGNGAYKAHGVISCKYCGFCNVWVCFTDPTAYVIKLDKEI